MSTKDEKNELAQAIATALAAAMPAIVQAIRGWIAATPARRKKGA